MTQSISSAYPTHLLTMIEWIVAGIMCGVAGLAIAVLIKDRMTYGALLNKSAGVGTFLTEKAICNFGLERT